MRNLGHRRKEYIANHAQEEFIVPLVKQCVESIVKEFSNKIKDKKVIDIGSGNQPFRAMIEDAGGKYFSLDIEQHFKTETDFEGAIDKELNPQIADFGPFAFILCTEVLEHVADWDKAFTNFHKLLAEDGVLLTTTPFFFPLHEIPYDYWRPTPYALSYFSERHGLVVERCEKIGGFLDVLGTLYGNHIHVRPLKPSIIKRVQNKMIHLYIKYSLKIIKSRYLHKHFEISNPHYQSNVCLITKKC